jgi:hypothetical protein
MAPASLNTELLLDQLVGEFEAGRIGQGVLLLAGMLDGAAENAAGIALARAALAQHPLRHFLHADPAVQLAASDLPRALALIASGVIPSGLSRCGTETFRAVGGLGFAQGLQERRSFGADALAPAWRRGERIALIDCGELGELDPLRGTALDNVTLCHSDPVVLAALRQEHGLTAAALPDHTFDVMLAASAADQLDPGALTDRLSDLATRLAPGGVLYLSSFAPGHLGFGWQTVCLGRDLVCHDETTLERCAASAGLMIRHMRGASGSLIWGELRHAAAPAFQSGRGKP